MNTKSIFHSLVLILLLLSGCGREENRDDLSDRDPAWDSLLIKSDSILRSTGTSIAEQKNARDSSVADMNGEGGIAPFVPESLPRVDVTQWAGMTYEKLDQILGEFSLTDPPSIRYYGICDRIQFTFSENGTRAMLREIICTLDKTYRVRDALQVLGIAVVKEISVRGNGYVESTFGNPDVARVRSFVVGSDSLKTKKIAIRFQ